jgi:hypothetical protein
MVTFTVILICICYLNDDSHMLINSVVVQEWRGAACCEEEPHIFICKADCFSPHTYLIIVSKQVHFEASTDA